MKQKSIPDKLQELINQYYSWRENNELGGIETKHARCEVLDQLWVNWLLKHHENQFEEYRNDFKDKMNYLTNCYGIVEEKRKLEAMREELRESLKKK